MNPAIAPFISFPTSGESPGGSLAFTNGFFTSTNFFNDTFIANYAAIDQNALIQNIDVNVSGARDFAGNLMNPQTVPDVFTINTQNPIVTSLAVNKTSILVSDRGTDFVISIAYREAMQTTTAPTITFSQNVSKALTFVSASSGWNANGTVYTAVYRIGGTNIVIPAININISGAVNSTGHPQLNYTASNAFSINLLNNATAVFRSARRRA
jgi:hypothetical protein